MVQIYPDEGLITALLRIVENDGNGLTWALYSNDLDPSPASVFTDFTLIADLWARTQLLASDFTLTQVISHVATIQAAAIDFTNSEGVSRTAYGYFIYDQVDEKVIAAARFDDAPVTILPGGTKTVAAIIGGYSESVVPEIDGGVF